MNYVIPKLNVAIPSPPFDTIDIESLMMDGK